MEEHKLKNRKGTNGCLYNCVESCTGECMKGMRPDSQHRKRSVDEVLSQFENGEYRYHMEPLFRVAIDSLVYGGSSESIIGQLIDIINNQYALIQSLIKNEK